MSNHPGPVATDPCCGGSGGEDLLSGERDGDWRRGAAGEAGCVSGWVRETDGGME